MTFRGVLQIICQTLEKKTVNKTVKKNDVSAREESHADITQNAVEEFRGRSSRIVARLDARAGGGRDGACRRHLRSDWPVCGRRFGR